MMENNEEHIKVKVKNGIKEFLSGRFSLNDDSAAQSTVEENIRKSVDFRGQNLWILIFAILIASVGLNVNSSAVIIGAMLVSPLMGPIMGFGLSLGIYDFELLKRSFRNLIFAVAVSLTTSTIYFMLSPLTEAQSEILARTTPTIWDVLIALSGGLAGIVAQTRTDRTTTVIPGVAIATALMPPLCTAGYGLGTMQLQYFIGALYLFTINAVLITLATFLVVRYLKYEKKQQLDKQRERKVRIYIYSVIFITIIPSVVLAYNIVTKSVFETNSRQFVKNSFSFKETQVVDYKARIVDGKQELTILLIGQKLSDDAITSLENQKVAYNLDETELIIQQQGLESNTTSSQSIEKLYDVSNLLIKEKDAKIAKLEDMVKRFVKDTLSSSEISQELSALTDSEIEVALSKSAIYNSRGEATDTTLLCLIRSNNEINMDERSRQRITNWLKTRTKTNNIELMMVSSEDKK